MRRAFLVRTVAAVFAVVLLAGQASAALITQISWSITGGSMTGPSASGPVTGGSFTITPVLGTLSTPGSGSFVWTLSLTLGAFSAASTGFG